MKYTIIITVYNKEKFLDRAIRSALNQNYDDYVVMVVNDGSTDNSEKIINKYKDKVDYYKKENTGVADTRNFAIEKVRTEFFLFLDADDYLSDTLLDEIDKYGDYDVLSFNAFNLNKNFDLIKKMNKPVFIGTGDVFFEKMVDRKSEFTVPWGYVYKTVFFKKNKFKYPKGKILEDYFLTPFIIIEAKKIISIDFYGYYYVTNDNSIIQGDRNLIAETYLEHFDNMLKIINKYDVNVQKNFKSFLAGTLIWYGSQLTGEQRKHYIKILKGKKIVKLLDRPYIRKEVVNIMFNLNIYYPLRKFLKRGK